MNTSVKNVVLVLGGLIIGCGVATIAPAHYSAAQAPAGGWRCYVVDRFPDVREAGDWHGARKMSEGMNQVAPQSPPGTVITALWSAGSSSIACVKN
jgi:hypothetical protein